MKSRSGFFIFLIYILTFLSCSPLKNIKKSEQLFYRQSIKGNKEIPKSDLKTNYQLTPNKNLFNVFPGIAIYNFGYSFFDSNKVIAAKEKVKTKFEKKIKEDSNHQKKKDRLIEKKDKRLTKLDRKLNEGNWVMRMGEAPIIFDTSKINLTEKLIKHSVFSNGYFHSKVELQIDSSKRKVAVNYLITEGNPSYVSSIQQTILDPKIDTIVSNSDKDSYIKINERYKEENLQNELNRLTRLLRDNGYYDFESRYIYFNVDTTRQYDSVRIQLVIKNPKGKKAHPVYTVNSVQFITDENKVDSNEVYDTVFYNNTRYIFPKRELYPAKILDRKIRIHSGDTYNLSLSDQTQKNLNFLDIFRTTNIKYTKDTVNHTLTTKIYTFTLPHYQINGQTGFNISQSTVPGPFGSINYKHRNSLQKLGVFELTAKAAIAAQASILEPTDVLRTEEYIFQTSLALPQLYLPFFRKLKWEDNDPETKGTAGFNIVDRAEYKRSAVQSGLIYSINPDLYTSILFSPIDIYVINTNRVSTNFQEYLLYLQSRGNNLIQSFNSSYVSDINFSYIFNNFSLQENKKAHYIKYYFESGGTFLNLVRKDKMFGLETFRYLKYNAEYRFYRPIQKSTFATRYNIGAAYPYGENNALPYEKYYFAGGPNSIRAWPIRRLGPGSFAAIDSATGKINNNIEAPGEFILESNLEYRFKIAGFFEGATFVDIGNVWMLRKDPAQPGAQLNLKKIFSQLAVGTGVGLRLNFSFVLIRFDLGLKVYDPALQKFVFLKNGLRGSILNFGIGYPF